MAKEYKGESELLQVYMMQTVRPDGTVDCKILRAVKPSEFVKVKEAAGILGVSKRQVQHLCDIGQFKTARRQSPGDRGAWVIARWEVLGLEEPEGK